MTTTDLIEKPALVLIHPSRLFFESLNSVLRNTPYKIEIYADNFESLYTNSSNIRFVDPIFFVGGHTVVQIVETVRSIHSLLNGARIVVIGAPSEPHEIMLTLEAGASGYFREAMSTQTLITAIELVLQDETIVPPEFVRNFITERYRIGHIIQETELTPNKQIKKSEDMVSRSPLNFSLREQTILRALIDGASNKLIAQELCITEATVKVHVKSILRKMRVKNRTQAAMWAVKYCYTNPS